MKTTSYSDLKGKTALITGAGAGIGRAIAEALVSTGANVILNDIDEALASKAASDIEASGEGRCLAVGGDAGDVKMIDQMVELAMKEFGRVDYAIPNAGITVFGAFDEVTPDEFDRIMHVNLRGAYFLTQRATLAMRKGGNPGRVVLMSSNVGVQSYPMLSAYSMTKSALQMMARNLVAELGPHGITINALAPGATLTERTIKEQDDYAGVWSELVPRGAIAVPEDIANTCLFLLSDASRHINGQTIVVDGGWVVTSPLPKEVTSDDVDHGSDIV
ncbi:MAG: SDR family NAD(P)-dependent oxidoreductase [Saprospiraceae bacterium]